MEKCNFCEKYDFRRAFFKEDGGIYRIALVGGGRLAIPPESERLRFCPKCGRRLTLDDFKGKME